MFKFSDIKPETMFLSAKEALEYQYKHKGCSLWHFSSHEIVPSYWVCSKYDLRELGGSLAKPLLCILP